MSGHTYTHTHTHTHTYTYTHDNYYNPRCAHAHRGLITNIYAVNRTFVKCYSNKKQITALEAPLQAQHKDVWSVFVAYTERKL